MKLTVINIYARMVTLEFGPQEFKGGHISADNGQGVVATRTCTKFSCQEWVDHVAVYPVLQGEMSRCPRCDASYGAANTSEMA